MCVKIPFPPLSVRINFANKNVEHRNENVQKKAHKINKQAYNYTLHYTKHGYTENGNSLSNEY